MPEQRDEWSLDVGQVVRRVRRRWRVIALTAAVGVLLGATVGILAPRQYESTASVTVLPIRLPGSTSSQTINIDTERAVMLSREVATLAAKTLERSVTADVLDSTTTVAAPEGSEVLQTTVSAPSAAQAAERADALADAYLSFRAQGALQAAQPSIDALDERIAAASRNDPRILVDLQSQRTALEHVGDATGRVIGRAVPPTGPSSFGLPFSLAGGLAAGLLLGAVLALLRDATDRRVRFAPRLFEVAGREGVVLRAAADDVETTRWILRAFRPARGDGADVTVVAVFGDDPRTAACLTRTLERAAAEIEHRIRVVDADTVLDAGLDRSRPARADRGVDLLVVDGSRMGSAARRAALADVVDGALVVAGRRSRVGVVRMLAALIAPTDARPLVPVFAAFGGTDGVAVPVEDPAPRPAPMAAAIPASEHAQEEQEAVAHVRSAVSVLDGPDVAHVLPTASMVEAEPASEPEQDPVVELEPVMEPEPEPGPEPEPAREVEVQPPAVVRAATPAMAVEVSGGRSEVRVPTGLRALLLQDDDLVVHDAPRAELEDRPSAEAPEAEPTLLRMSRKPRHGAPAPVRIPPVPRRLVRR